MNFLEAVKLAFNEGAKIKRKAWKDKDIDYVMAVSAFPTKTLITGGDDCSVPYLPYIESILADDWEVVE